MNQKDDVTEDDVKRIHALASQGFGRNSIADYIGINASAVKSVLDGQRKNISDKLSVRQRGELINRAFGPIHGR